MVDCCPLPTDRCPLNEFVFTCQTKEPRRQNIFNVVPNYGYSPNSDLDQIITFYPQTKATSPKVSYYATWWFSTITHNYQPLIKSSVITTPNHKSPTTNNHSQPPPTNHQSPPQTTHQKGEFAVFSTHGPPQIADILLSQPVQQRGTLLQRLTETPLTGRTPARWPQVRGHRRRRCARCRGHGWSRRPHSVVAENDCRKSDGGKSDAKLVAWGGGGVQVGVGSS